MEKFTKIYESERKLLRKADNAAAYEVYMHLKNDSSYYKGEFYDLTKCIAEYLEISLSTTKRAIKALKEVGLIEVSKKGKVNVYKLPYAQAKAVKENVNENKGDFRPEIPQDDTRVQQDIESVSNRLKTSKNGVLEIPSNVIKEMGRYANDDSIPINERYGNISKLFKPYSRNIPSHKINDYINSIYNKLREVA